MSDDLERLVSDHINMTQYGVGNALKSAGLTKEQEEQFHACFDGKEPELKTKILEELQNANIPADMDIFEKIGIVSDAAQEGFTQNVQDCRDHAEKGEGQNR